MSAFTSEVHTVIPRHEELRFHGNLNQSTEGTEGIALPKETKTLRFALFEPDKVLLQDDDLVADGSRIRICGNDPI